MPSEPLAAAIGYYQRHKAVLFRFIHDPRVPIDSSPAERLLQNVAKLRLNMLFAGSTKAAHRACVCSASSPPVALTASTLRPISLGPSSDSARIATSSG